MGNVTYDPNAEAEQPCNICHEFAENCICPEVFDYKDDNGVQWVMAACGHYVGGSPKPGDKIPACPNCRFLARFGQIDIKYPGLLPLEAQQN